ncbi:FIG01964566: Predicted membrane protein, hemolysin III homolog, partial [Arthrobacter sp. DR-2P]
EQRHPGRPADAAPQREQQRGGRPRNERGGRGRRPAGRAPDDQAEMAGLDTHSHRAARPDGWNRIGGACPHDGPQNHVRRLRGHGRPPVRSERGVPSRQLVAPGEDRPQAPGPHEHHAGDRRQLHAAGLDPAGAAPGGPPAVGHLVRGHPRGTVPAAVDGCPALALRTHLHRPGLRRTLLPAAVLPGEHSGRCPHLRGRHPVHHWRCVLRAEKAEHQLPPLWLPRAVPRLDRGGFRGALHGHSHGCPQL